MDKQRAHIRVGETLEKYYRKFNRLDFIENDPISVPHRFDRLQDIEIMAFWAAMLAWGQRMTTINKCNELIELMDGAPYDFIVNHTEKDLKRFMHFKHRTFNYTDTLYFINFFKRHYETYDSLETAFLHHSDAFYSAEANLSAFHQYFFAHPDAPQRTAKHVATPMRNSTCKRLNMFLRWMVRKDDGGVDFGLWKNIPAQALLCPLDVHVDRVARRFGLITRKQTDWKTVLELTESLRQFDPKDPVKYDYALFGLGIFEKAGK